MSPPPRGPALSYLKPDEIEKIEEMLGKLQPKYNRLLLTFGHRQFSSEQGAEYARHGYLRRTGTLKRCIENVFTLIPPNETEIPSRNILFDAQINIQAFFANVYGSIDNLA
jgi:hypothetical protein